LWIVFVSSRINQSALNMATNIKEDLPPKDDNFPQPNATVYRSKMESFSELDKIENEKVWYKHKPIPILQRRKSIKGSQSFSFFNREFYFPKNHTDEFKKMFLTWLVVTLLAIAVCLAGLAIDWGVNCTFYAVYGVSQSIFISPHREDISPLHLALGFLTFALSSAIFAFLSSYLVVFHAPLAEGSGIPDVKSYLNGVHLQGLFSMSTAFAKAVGCAFSIGSGLIAGREGPIIHVGAILGSGISQGASEVFGYRTPSWLNKHFRSAEWKRDFAVMGSAFGVAAAFIAPMGGVLFAIEEGATVWRQQLTFVTMYGAVITAFFASLIKGYINSSQESPVMPAILFGSYREDAAEIIFRANDFPYVFLIAITGGLVGAAFSTCQRIIMPLRKKYVRTNKYYTVLEVVLVSLFISSLRFWVPFVFGSCIDNHNFHESQGDKNELANVPDPIPFHCEGEKTNDLGVMLWLPSEYMLKWLLHTDGYNDISTAHLIFSFFFYFFGAVLTFGLAIPSGLFIPAFVIGGTYGRLVGQLAAYSTGNYSLITSYTFLGSASALGGITRVTISVALIALESTQNFNTSLYCFFVVITAKLIADSFNIGIYDLVIEKKDIPFLVDELGYEAYQLSTDTVMTPIQATTEVQGLDRTLTNKQSTKSLLLEVPDERKGMATVLDVDSLENIAKVLINNPGEFEFLADNKKGGLEGTIERLYLIRLLEHKLIGLDAPLLHPTSVDSAWPNLRNHLSTSEESNLIAEVSKTHDLRTSLLDLRPYIDREPAIVLNNSSMRKAHAHIRNGERNILVAASSSVNIIGVIKRHDIMPGTLGALLKAKKRHMQKCAEKMTPKLLCPPSKSSHPLKTTIQDVDDEAHADSENDEVTSGASGGFEMTAYDLQVDSDMFDDTVLGRPGSPRRCSRTRTRSSSGGEDAAIGTDGKFSLSPFEPRFYDLLRAYLHEKKDLSEQEARYVLDSKQCFRGSSK
jgi:chloride channel 7